MNKRRKFTPEHKVRIVRRHLVDRVSVSDLCDEEGVHPNAFYRWQKELFENGASAFRRENGGRERRLSEKVSRLEARLGHKDEVIAEIMADHVKLKKSLGEI